MRALLEHCQRPMGSLQTHMQAEGGAAHQVFDCRMQAHSVRHYRYMLLAGSVCMKQQVYDAHKGAPRPIQRSESHSMRKQHAVMPIAGSSQCQMQSCARA
jgi:hypothetical protein